MNNKALLTVDEVADFLRVAPNTVYRWLRSGKIKGTKIGKEWRIAQNVLAEFAGLNTTGGRGPSLQQLLDANLTAPEHILVMQSNREDVFVLQADFLKVGLEAGHPLFVGAWWQSIADLRTHFAAAGLPVEQLEESGRLVFEDLGAAYQLRGVAGVIEIWQAQTKRVTAGHVLWGTGSHCLSDWTSSYQALIHFEHQLHRAFETLPVIALCPCVLDHVNQSNFELLMRLVSHHSSALFNANESPILLKAVN